MSRSILRILIGVIMGGFAGLSFATAVVPIVVGQMFDVYSVDLLLGVQDLALPLAVGWIVLAAIIAWQGGAWFGALVLGLGGALSGFILGQFGLGGDSSLVMVAALAGLIYGGIGGMIIGRALPIVLSEPQ